MDSSDPKLIEQMTNELLKGKRIFLSGAAGTGKTWLVKRLAEKIAELKKTVYATASTGIASTHLYDDIGIQNSFIKGPSTLYSAAMLPWSEARDNEHFIENGKLRLAGTDVVIVDEISMLDSRTFNRFMKRVEPNMGILAVGDFFQLPPVHCDDNGPDFAFRSKAFQEFRLVELTKVYRQNEPKFLNFLFDLRHGRHQKDFYFGTSYEFDLKHPVLFGTRREADYHNNMEIDKLDSKLYSSKCSVSMGEPQKAMEWFKNYTKAAEECKLKEGMRVLCIQNHDEMVNGDIGTLTTISNEKKENGEPAWIEIEFDRTRIGKRKMERYPFRKEIWKEDRNYIEFEVKQFPVIPAYGLTVHKAQGMTLDIVNIDGRKINFAAGQVYVAISRCTSKAGLRIKNAKMFEAFTRKSVENYYIKTKHLEL